jgi:hypothetical protein
LSVVLFDRAIVGVEPALVIRFQWGMSEKPDVEAAREPGCTGALVLQHF